MKDNHRSGRLDEHIGHKVIIFFYDGMKAEGVLGYSEKLDLMHGRPAGRYFLQRPQGDVVFRKTHVEKILVPGGELF